MFRRFTRRFIALQVVQASHGLHQTSKKLQRSKISGICRQHHHQIGFSSIKKSNNSNHVMGFHRFPARYACKYNDMSLFYSRYEIIVTFNMIKSVMEGFVFVKLHFFVCYFLLFPVDLSLYLICNLCEQKYLHFHQ